MPALTRTSILFCGQGMATLIEYYPNGNATSAPSHLVLVDFGGNQLYAEEASAYVVEKLKRQVAAGIAPSFDTVVISHQDGDHLSLLASLTAAIEKAGITVTCVNWYAGGTNWSKRNKNRVEAFAAAMTDDDDAFSFDAPFDSDYTGKKTRAQLSKLTTFGKTFIRVVISGLKLSGAPDDIIRNASSTVLAVENGNWSIILPGDATYHTMQKVNDFYKAWKTTPLIPQVYGLEIPHHGALRTAVENYTAQTPLANLNFKIIDQFAKDLKPKQIAASAGPRNSHAHPVKEVLDVFDKDLETSGARTYVAWVFDKKKAHKVDGWEQFSTTKGVQTTVQKIVGSVMWGNIYYDITDATATGQALPQVTFEPRGTVEDLLARYGDVAASDPWLRDAMAASSPPPDDDILRAPAPDAGEGEP